jgi:hypothetical protein
MLSNDNGDSKFHNSMSKSDEESPVELKLKAQGEGPNNDDSEDNEEQD